MLINYVPLEDLPVTLDLSKTISDGFGLTAPRYFVDDNGLVHEQWVVRPGKLDGEVIGYQTEWMRGDD